jgi:hypothetical protein
MYCQNIKTSFLINKSIQPNKPTLLSGVIIYMKNLLEKAIYAELNKDPMADTLLRQFVISRCAQINEALRKGKEFVLEDLDGPTVPDLEITQEELLIDTPVSDDEIDSDDDGDFVLDDGFNVDADNSGDVSAEEEAAAMEHLRAAIDELEAMFAEDDDEDTDMSDDSDDVEPEVKKPSVAESRRARKVRESTIVTRKPDATITVEFEDSDTAVTAEFDEDSATVTGTPSDEDEGTVVSTDGDDTADLGLDLEDGEEGTTVRTVESRRAAARARVIEGRKARAAKVTAKKK